MKCVVCGETIDKYKDGIKDTREYGYYCNRCQVFIGSYDNERLDIFYERLEISSERSKLFKKQIKRDNNE